MKWKVCSVSEVSSIVCSSLHCQGRAHCDWWHLSLLCVCLCVCVCTHTVRFGKHRAPPLCVSSCSCCSLFSHRFHWQRFSSVEADWWVAINRGCVCVCEGVWGGEAHFESSWMNARSRLRGGGEVNRGERESVKDNNLRPNQFMSVESGAVRKR